MTFSAARVLQMAEEAYGFAGQASGVAEQSNGIAA